MMNLPIFKFENLEHILPFFEDIYSLVRRRGVEPLWMCFRGTRLADRLTAQKMAVGVRFELTEDVLHPLLFSRQAQ